MLGIPLEGPSFVIKKKHDSANRNFNTYRIGGGSATANSIFNQDPASKLIFVISATTFCDKTSDAKIDLAASSRRRKVATKEGQKLKILQTRLESNYNCYLERSPNRKKFSH